MLGGLVKQPLQEIIHTQTKQNLMKLKHGLVALYAIWPGSGGSGFYTLGAHMRHSNFKHAHYVIIAAAPVAVLITSYY